MLRLAARRARAAAARHACFSSSSPPPPPPLQLLGLPPGASRQAIKARYYELAKLTHPDSRAAADDARAAELPPFAQVHAAFEELMAGAGGAAEGQGVPRTSPNHAARGGGGGGGVRGARGGGGGGPTARPKTLGEVLVEQLEEDPGAVGRVWGDIKARRLAVNGTVLDALFRACGRGHTEGGGLAGALAILRDATAQGLLTPEVRHAGLVSLIKWCKEDGQSFGLIYNELTESEKSSDVLEMIGNANFLYRYI
ncbi:hypothetical protein AB1Y20_010760 [Prymnesium parvum]|uniref:J domain-containing protein n=1 Tax=Prymnesium parvum TaxID=97485 RepID=A0AB34IS96_PRYPA